MTGDKEALRRHFRAHPGSGDDDALQDRLLRHPWFREAEAVMAFVPMAAEPGLSRVLREILDSGRTLALPRCEDGTRMTARRVLSLEALVPGPFGIPEPAPEAPPMDPGKLDLVLTPGMAFDRRGGRLGRGKGYYDRFLACTEARTIGLCYDTNLIPFVPMDGHDRPMDALVTDRERLFFGRKEGNL